MKTDLRQSEGWSRYLASQGWEVEEIDGAEAYIRKLPFYGSVIKIQRPSVIPSAEAIDELARKHHALFVKLEPAFKTREYLADSPTSAREHLRGVPQAQPHLGGGGIAAGEELNKAGFKPDPTPSLPTKTIIIDLTKSEEELWRNLSQDARQSIKKAAGYQLLAISYRYGESKFDKALKSFHQLLRETSRRQDFWTPSFNQLKTKLECFGKNAALFLAYPPSPEATEGQVHPLAGRLRRPASPRGETSPLAGALILIHGGVSYGHLAASSNKGRKLYASYFLMWEMIKFLKNPKSHPPATPERSDPPTSSREASRAGGGRGTLSPIRYFDLEGIYDPRYHKLTKDWQGFTAFKRKFGGREVEYPQPLIKYYHPLAKLLFKLSAL